MRIGLVGAGPWAQGTHAPALAAHPGVDFAGVWARSRGRAHVFGVPVFAQFGDLLDHVDAVAFAVPPAVQGELAVVAAHAGKHVILEKPLAETVGGAQAIVDAVRRSGVRSIMVLTRRFAPETREFLRQAHAGEWSAGSAMWLSGALLGGAFAQSQWRQDLGALSDIGPHLLDLVDSALGPITGVRFARCEPTTSTWTVGLRHRRPHTRGLVGPHEEVTSTVTMSQRTPVRPSLLRVTVHGLSGVAELAERSTPSVDCYRILLDEFLQSCALGAEHACSAQHGLHLQKVIEQIGRSVSS